MDWLWWTQLGLDVLLLAAVVYLVLRLRSPRSASRGATPADLERFLGEATRLTQEFDRLLGEKRELVGTTIKTLDNRISHLQAMAAQLKDPPPAPRPAPPAAPAAPVTPAPAPAAPEASQRIRPEDFRALVLRLAGQGKTAQEIAQTLGRPRGEVDLVLGLSAQG